MANDRALREQLVWLLTVGNAHVGFERAVSDVPVECQSHKPESLPHTLWQLLEHMRICQWDILEFSRDAEHISPDFPDGYWPETAGPPHEQAWQQCVAAFQLDLQAMCELISDESVDLHEPFAHGDGQTLLREALLLADHNAYHIGQLVTLRRVLDCWPEA